MGVQICGRLLIGQYRPPVATQPFECPQVPDFAKSKPPQGFVRFHANPVKDIFHIVGLFDTHDSLLVPSAAMTTICFRNRHNLQQLAPNS
jgi:hypothetical protein